VIPAHVAVPPALSDPSTLPALHALLNILHHRASRDTTRSGRPQAEALLNGLQSVSSVVLNGRAPGDEEGAHTYWTGEGAAHCVGQSVVDLGCVSATLYQRVRWFRVLPFWPDASKDHCALYTEIHGLHLPHVQLRPRRPPVYRPSKSEYVRQLVGQRAQFAGLLHNWEEGGVSVSQAVEQLTTLLVACARNCCRGPPPPHLLLRARISRGLMLSVRRC
jgi:hypothetical protein